jgi:DNA-binding transcriptional regulator LsrR (DeoR family)
MSFREITMQDVSEVLRRWQAGQSARRIAREMGMDRKTVGRYIDEARAGGLVAEIAVTEELARAVGKGVQTAAAAASVAAVRRRSLNGAI